MSSLWDVERPELSVVIPVYGCADCVRPLHSRLTAVLGQLVDTYELIFVDDRSPGDDWMILRAIAEGDPAVRLVRLSRNFGQHAAITAGLERSRGRHVVVMDCDLQDPPEEIPRLYAAAMRGAEIVFTRRKGRQHSMFRRWASRLYSKLLNAALKTNLDYEIGAFSLASRKVVDAALRVSDVDRNYVMILGWLGFEQTTVEYAHRDRHSGKSSYSFGALLRFALDGLFFQTTTLLRWIIYAGFGISASGAALAGYYIIHYFVSGSYPGWTTLGVLVLLLSGFIIVSTGVTGLYIGKIFTQVKGRPLYVVEEEVVGTIAAPASTPEHSALT
jgi:glycosyltransferase involved in cell wall biosynthesis